MGPSTKDLLQRVGLFVGITWSLTAGFELLTKGGQLLFEAASGRGRGGKVSASLCTPPASVVAAPPDQRRVAALTAWRLGTSLGFAASARDAQPAIAALDQQQRATVSLAMELGVPAPVLGPLAPPSARLTRFADSINQDETCIAGALARRYSLRHADIFRFGAFAGYVQHIRGARPGSLPLVDELAYYGHRAEVDEKLCRVLVADLGKMSPADAQRELKATIESVEQQLLPDRRETVGAP
jgi:hypothetical protein